MEDIQLRFTVEILKILSFKQFSLASGELLVDQVCHFHRYGVFLQQAQNQASIIQNLKESGFKILQHSFRASVFPDKAWAVSLYQSCTISTGVFPC